MPDIPTREQFVRDNTNGWVVVYHGIELSRKRNKFANVSGPFATQQEANNFARRLRRKYQRGLAGGVNLNFSEMEKISVRPLWKPDGEVT